VRQPRRADPTRVRLRVQRLDRGGPPQQRDGDDATRTTVRPRRGDRVGGVDGGVRAPRRQRKKCNRTRVRCHGVRFRHSVHGDFNECCTVRQLIIIIISIRVDLFGGRAD